MAREKLRLFVWTEYARDYSSGLAVALASDSDHARDLIAEKQGYRSSELAESPEVYDLDLPMAFVIAGGT